MEIKDIKCTDLASDISRVCAGRKTVEVYLAIGMVLAHMERLAEKPDREGLFELLDKLMTEQIAANS